MAKNDDLIVSLKKCSVRGNIVALPTEMLPNYPDVKKALMNAGGTYKKNTFVFPNDAQPYIDRLTGGESVNIKKEFQFFGTPDHLADRIIELAHIKPGHNVCEPEIGQAALIKAMWRAGHKNLVWAWELMEINRNIVKELSDDILIEGEDFLKAAPKFNNYFDRVIANPPFTKNQDIDHIRKMYDVCKHGGKIVSIASNHWRHSQNKKEKEFRFWLNELDSDIEEVEAGEFKESGTSIAACIVTINK